MALKKLSEDQQRRGLAGLRKRKKPRTVEFITDEENLVAHTQIEKGYAYNVHESLITQLELSEINFSRLIGISVSTLKRRRGGRFTTEESDRMYRLQKLLDRTEEVLEGHEAAIEWLKSPKRALNERKPIDLTISEAGVHEVEQLLGRIEHGIFS